jgi:negative regulator of sigma E activity
VNAPSDERLMLYFDGEVDDAEAREISAWLESSERARLVVSSFERVGAAVRAIGDDRGAGGVDIADAVMAHIERADVKTPDGAPIIGAMAPSRARPAGRRWAAMAPAIGLAMAAAAVVALYLRPRLPSSPVGTAPSVVAAASEQLFPALPAASEEAAGTVDFAAGAAIESVDFGAVAGTIFMVPSGSSSDESETPVVWLMDDPTPNEGRMAPL